MERCNFSIMPRQSGKTHSLVIKASSLLDEGYSVAFIVHNMPMKRYIMDRYREEPGSHVIFTVDEYIRYVNEKVVRIKQFDYTLIDEYLFLDVNKQQKLYNVVPNMTKDVVIIKTTSPRLYNKELVNFCIDYKNLQNKFGKIIDRYSLTFKNPKDSIEFNELMGNFLTDPKTSLHIEYNNLKTIYGKEQFELQFLGKIFKEDE